MSDAIPVWLIRMDAIGELTMFFPIAASPPISMPAGWLRDGSSLGLDDYFQPLSPMITSGSADPSWNRSAPPHRRWCADGHQWSSCRWIHGGNDASSGLPLRARIEPVAGRSTSSEVVQPAVVDTSDPGCLRLV